MFYFRSKDLTLFLLLGAHRKQKVWHCDCYHRGELEKTHKLLKNEGAKTLRSLS